MPLSFPRIGIDFVLGFVKLMSLELKEGNILLNDALNTTTAPATTTFTTTSTATITTTSTSVLFNTHHILFIVICRRTYGKWQFR